MPFDSLILIWHGQLSLWPMDPVQVILAQDHMVVALWRQAQIDPAAVAKIVLHNTADSLFCKC